MSSPVGLLDFFILEAGEYVEQLDGVLARAGAGRPDGTGLLRHSRMLRGSATMARQGTLAELAGGIERVARGLADSSLQWDPSLRGTMIAAVDDLKILVRNLRQWGPAEDQRARARIAELARIAPQLGRPYTPSATGPSAIYLVVESGEIANALDALGQAPADRAALENALGRVRAVRGIAAIRDLPPLADVVETIERALKPMELGAEPTAAVMTFVQAAATVMHRISSELRIAGRPDPGSAEVQRFLAAAGALDQRGTGEADHIVPISELFFQDGQSGLVSSAEHPPTTPAERFRLEVVSQAEHLRRLIAEAREATEGAVRQRATRDLQSALGALRSAAESFGERDLAAVIGTSIQAVGAFNERVLGTLDEMAATLANPATSLADALRRLRDQVVAPAPARARAPAESVAAPATRAAPSPRGAPRRPATPSGSQLQSLLRTGLSALGQLAERPLSQPVPLVDESLVPIETLLYRGESALARALEVREEVRRSGAPPSPDALAELFDLIELAATPS